LSRSNQYRDNPKEASPRIMKEKLSQGNSQGIFDRTMTDATQNK